MAKEKKEEKKTNLTVEELQILINLVAGANVQVRSAGQFIELINKMSKMVDELGGLPKEEKKDK